MDTPINAYKLAYDKLFAQLPKSVQEKVSQVKGSDKVPPPEVREFIKAVIAMAEQDD